ncbi:amino acid adenylation domain-containing protein [Nonomuraea antimicrobica]
MHFPIGYAQQRIMVIERLAPGTSAYNVPFALRLRGNLDVAALEWALTAVVARHEALRTTIDTVDGELVQVVRSAIAVPLQRRNLSGTPAATDQAELTALLSDQAAEPLALDECLLRVTLHRLSQDDHVLAVTMHHLVSDYWSCGIFVRDLSALYDSCLTGRPAELPELSVQYADYVIWQRENLREDRLARLTAFWRGELEGAPEVLHLPSDRPRPAAQSYRGAVERVEIPEDVSRAVLALSRELGATPFMTLLAAFQLVIARWTGQDDVVVSTGTATRTPQVEQLIGSFINIVLIRTSLAGNPSFAALVRQAKPRILAAFDHQDLPFERLVAELGPRRALSHQPLTQVMFVVQNAPMPNPAMGDLVVTAEPVPRHATQLDVDLQLWLAGERFEGFVEYSSDMYDGATMRRLMRGFVTLLSAAVTAPDTPIDDLPALTAEELSQTVSDWNATAADYPARTLYELISERVTAQPDAVALTYAGGRLTYAELDERVRALAGRLQAAGVGPDVLVGVCLDSTVDRFVAVLGVLAAGGAYLPLDPDHPAERLAFMLADARPAALVSRSDLLDRLPDTHQAICLDDDAEPAPYRRPRVSPDNLAYVIYTSGSTGRPKGIAVPHRGVVNNIADLNRLGRIGPEDNVLSVSSMSFDMSVYELTGLLVAGGSVVLPDPGVADDPRHWHRLVTGHRVTVWNSAPALLEALATVAERTGEPLPSLRTAFLGGDWIPVTLPGRMRALAPGMAFVSLGGATEASIHSIVHPVDEVDPAWTSIPYGRPQDNQQALILDARGRVVPVGVPGELHLGGIGLTRGYLRRPARTAERFIPHPYAGRYPNVPAGARLYRTGDLARYRTDGVIELLGRLDQQIKIRGYRIEPGEIEAALVESPDLAEAVVVARHAASGSAVLVAYVVPAGSGEPDEAGLLARLRDRLPGYMVPSSIVALDRLPLSPNGKIDRRALARLGHSGPDRAGYVVAGSPLEQVLTDIWAAVLSMERVGVEDDFFQLGGHSLNGMEVVALIQDTFGLEVPLRMAFEATTVAAQAAWLREAAEAPEAAEDQGVDLDATAELALRLRDMSDEEIDLLLTQGADK